MTFSQTFLLHPPADAGTPGKAHSFKASDFPETQKLLLDGFQEEPPNDRASKLKRLQKIFIQQSLLAGNNFAAKSAVAFISTARPSILCL